MYWLSFLVAIAPVDLTLDVPTKRNVTFGFKLIVTSAGTVGWDLCWPHLHLLQRWTVRVQGRAC